MAGIETDFDALRSLLNGEISEQEYLDFFRLELAIGESFIRPRWKTVRLLREADLRVDKRGPYRSYRREWPVQTSSTDRGGQPPINERPRPK